MILFGRLAIIATCLLSAGIAIPGSIKESAAAEMAQLHNGGMPYSPEMTKDESLRSVLLSRGITRTRVDELFVFINNSRSTATLRWLMGGVNNLHIDNAEDALRKAFTSSQNYDVSLRNAYSFNPVKDELVNLYFSPFYDKLPISYNVIRQPKEVRLIAVKGLSESLTREETHQLRETVDLALTNGKTMSPMDLNLIQLVLYSYVNQTSDMDFLIAEWNAKRPMGMYVFDVISALKSSDEGTSYVKAGAKMVEQLFDMQFKIPGQSLITDQQAVVFLCNNMKVPEISVTSRKLLLEPTRLRGDGNVLRVLRSYSREHPEDVEVVSKFRTLANQYFDACR